MAKKFKCVPIAGNQNYVIKVYDPGISIKDFPNIFGRETDSMAYDIIYKGRFDISAIKAYIYEEGVALESNPGDKKAYKNLLAATLFTVGTFAISDLIFSLEEHQVLTVFLILQGCLATGPALKESLQERKIQSDRTKRKKMLQDAIETLKKFEVEQLGAEKEESSKTK